MHLVSPRFRCWRLHCPTAFSLIKCQSSTVSSREPGLCVTRCRASEWSGWGLHRCSRGTGPSAPGTRLSKPHRCERLSANENLRNPSTSQDGVSSLHRDRDPEPLHSRTTSVSPAFQRTDRAMLKDHWNLIWMGACQYSPLAEGPNIRCLQGEGACGCRSTRQEVLLASDDTRSVWQDLAEHRSFQTAWQLSAYVHIAMFSSIRPIPLPVQGAGSVSTGPCVVPARDPWL